MSQAAAVPTLSPRSPEVLAVPTKAWLISPVFDLLLFANVAWPAVALASLLSTGWSSESLSFVQIYFLSTPHRWITLAMVFFDRDHFWRAPVRFGGVALALIALGLTLVGVATYWPSLGDSLVLLMMVDYVWNAWHFASQHAGISRIYGRATGANLAPRAAELEKAAIRLLVLWAFFRIAIDVGSHRFGAIGNALTRFAPWLNWADPLLVIPAWLLLATEFRAGRRPHPARLAYLLSVITLYTAQIVALRFDVPGWKTALFFAGAIFHAVEYLAICAWAARKKPAAAWGHFIPRSGLAMGLFMLVLGVTNHALNSQSAYAWMLVTLLVSLLHYAYDGMIWRSKPAKASRATV